MTQDRNTDYLDSEIQDAQENQQAREAEGDSGFEIPEKFRGKELAEIVKSYSELEKAYSRQGNQLGQMRQTFDEYIRSQSANPAPHAEEKRTPLTVDDIYDNPEESIRRVAESTTAPRIKQLEEELENSRRQTKLEKFEAKFPNWKKEAASPEFQNWVSESKYRTRLAAAADRWDLDAAEDLFSAFEETRRASEDKKSERRTSDLKNASLESSGPSTPARTKTFSRRELLLKRTMAAKGDWQAGEWMRENARAIDAAYAEGRIVD